MTADDEAFDGPTADDVVADGSAAPDGASDSTGDDTVIDGRWTLPQAGLVVVGTPIGNLGDWTPRAIDAVSRCSAVACEDTRRTGRLFSAAGLARRDLIVVNDHTEASASPALVERARRGELVGLVTDAGMPAVSDPGTGVVAAFADAGLPVVVVPGPTAVTTAVAGSGLPSGRFVFEGFLPRKGAARSSRLAEVAAETRTVVLYEAPHRLARTLADLGAVCGGSRRVALVREATKRFEEWFRGTLDDAIVWVGEQGKGEYVVVLDGAGPAPDATDDDLRSALAAEFDAGASTRDAVAAVVARFGVAKRRVYDLAIDR